MDNTTRSGSLQFYPRCRAKKIIPSVNWRPVANHNRKENTHNGAKAGLMGFIGYKVAMTSVSAKDETPDSMTKGKKIIVPGTIIECPSMKIYSIRFYKNGQVVGDVVVSNDKILKRKIKVVNNAETVKNFEEKIKKFSANDNSFDDVRVVVFSEVFKTGIGKKKPNLLEIGLSGSNKQDKLNFAKEKVGKEISVVDVFGASVGKLVDIHGVTKGYGLQGPMKRFGIGLKSHKAEKGQRRPGSLGPWKPSRTTFRAPQAGQVGFFTRVSYNNLVLKVGSVKEKDAKGVSVNVPGGYKRYGDVKTDFMILRGSVPGPKRRGIAITSAIRPTKFQAKKKLEVLELR